MSVASPLKDINGNFITCRVGPLWDEDLPLGVMKNTFGPMGITRELNSQFAEMLGFNLKELCAMLGDPTRSTESYVLWVGANI